MQLSIESIKLACPTPESWLDYAVGHIPALLSDHACCEKKAASMAISLMKHFYAYPKILSKLSKIAREELVHYEQVLRLHDQLGYVFQPKPSSRYARTLWQHATKSGPDALTDQLMICAIIEARSCERFHLLAPRLPEPLSDYYQRLYQAEKRHAEVYLEFACAQVEAAHVLERLQRLLVVEGSLILSPESVFRFHSGVPT